MTKFEAMRVAQELTKAVYNGLISEVQAKKQFKVIVSRYKQNDRFKNLQESDPNTWMLCATLLRKA